MGLKTAGFVAISVDPDQTPRSAASYLGLDCSIPPDPILRVIMVSISYVQLFCAVHPLACVSLIVNKGNR